MTGIGPLDTTRLQRRTVRTLAAAQVFSGLGAGSTIALGSILAVDLTGSDAWAGATNTTMSLGAAFVAMPLSHLAIRRGRRLALTGGLVCAVVGTLLIVAAITTRTFPLLLLGAAGVGVATAVNLQARFAVTDLAPPELRGRHLSLVVWAITVGAVIGPSLVTPGTVVSRWLGLPPYAGAFLISAAGMITGGAIIWLWLRPDPLLTRQELDAMAYDGATTGPSSTRRMSWSSGWAVCRPHPSAKAAVLAVAAAHCVMVAVMSMTPLHLQHEAGALHGHPDTIRLIGLTISAHIAGMYALSPVMGWMTDRLGARPTVLLGLLTLLGAVGLAGVLSESTAAVTVGLVLLGLGWSASTVAGSTLLVESLDPAERVAAQGFSDATMSFSGAASAAAAGPVMGLLGYAGLAGVTAVGITLAAVIVVSFTKPRRRSPLSRSIR